MYDEMERRRGEIERHRENGARLAQEFHKFESNGQGFIEFADAAVFDITFIEEPFVTYGAQMDLDALADLLLLEPNEAPSAIPMTTGIVTEWDQDNRGFYVGAWVGARVYFPSGDLIATDLDVLVNHHFTFTGIGIKDVPIDVRD